MCDFDRLQGNGFNIDLNRFVPTLLARNYGQNGELYALPFQRHLTALFYNKATFDAFGIPYPTDGMAWDEVIQLASRFTDSPNGVKYNGLDLLNGGGLFMLIRYWTRKPIILNRLLN